MVIFISKNLYGPKKTVKGCRKMKLLGNIRIRKSYSHFTVHKYSHEVDYLLPHLCSVIFDKYKINYTAIKNSRGLNHL